MTEAPRYMNRKQATYYVGMEDDVEEFDRAVGKEMPKPRLSINGKPMWDRHEIDAALDALPEATKEDIERCIREEK